MAKVKKIPFDLPSEKRFYDIKKHKKDGVGCVAVEYHDKAKTKPTGWQSHHANKELCETAVRMRKANLDGKNYLGLFPRKVKTREIDIY